MSQDKKSRLVSFACDEGSESCDSSFVAEDRTPSMFSSEVEGLRAKICIDEHNLNFLRDSKYRRSQIIYSMHHPHVFQSTGAYFGDSAANPSDQQTSTAFLSTANGSETIFHESPIPRILQMDHGSQFSKRLRYRRRQGECKSCIHWGQRKLFLGEIEFLTIHATPYSGTNTSHDRKCKNVVCIYAGAAPGNHLSLLASLFPTVEFVLVDPVPFHKDLHRDVVYGIRRNIQLIQEFMTDSLATSLKLKYSNSTILFISDVRSVDYRLVNFDDLESSVAEDMDHQQKWHEILCPQAGMYKFRLPWTSGSTRYLAGTIYLPVWGPQSTTEARLVVVNTEQSNDKVTDHSHIMYCDWDHDVYQEKMFYFNCVMRASLYDHDILGDSALGIDHCYDCSSEVHILKEYFMKISSCDNLSASIASLILQINKACHHSRTLATPINFYPSRGGAVKVGKQNKLKKRSRQGYSLKTYDIDSQQVIEHIPYDCDTHESNAENGADFDGNDYNLLKSHRYIWDVVQSIVNDRNLADSIESLLHNQDACTDKNKMLTWSDIPEVSLSEGYSREESYLGKLGYLGGSLVLHNSAADLWLWGILARDFSYHYRFYCSECNTNTNNNNNTNTNTNTNMCGSNEWPSLFNWLLARAPTSIPLNSSNAQYLASMYASQDYMKPIVFHDYFQKEIITNCIASLGKVVEPAILLPVFILLTSSGCAYFYSLYPSDTSLQWSVSEQPHTINGLSSILGESPIPCISKFCLPTKHYHHLTLLSGMLTIQWHSSEQILPIFSKRLLIVDLLMYEGKLISEPPRRKELLSWYMNDEFTFHDSVERLSLLHLSGFQSIESSLLQTNIE